MEVFWYLINLIALIVPRSYPCTFFLFKRFLHKNSMYISYVSHSSCMGCFVTRCRSRKDPPPEGAATRVVWGRQESSGGLSRPITAASLHTTLCSAYVLHAASRQPVGSPISCPRNKVTMQLTIHATKWLTGTPGMWRHAFGYTDNSVSERACRLHLQGKKRFPQFWLHFSNLRRPSP
jgi:hypothetical protein